VTPNEPIQRGRYPWQSPRAWHGMTLSVWLRLLGKNWFRVSPSRWPMACAITVVSSINSALRLVSEGLYGRRADQTKIEAPPILVLGHWRTGTTLLHELLVLDPRHGYPSTYECMAPHHFLWTGRVLPRFLGILLPKNRPMDNVAVGWDKPQEDEFALVNLGVPSTYLEWAFPNQPCPHEEYLTLHDLTDEERAAWRHSFEWFLKRLTFQHGQRIVLKSPTHTARVRTLLEMFPNAKFVHIVRDPLVVIPSTQKTWNSLADFFCLQLRRANYSMESIIDRFLRMDDAFETDRALFRPGQFHEMRYEDLIADPLGAMRGVYEALGLPGFEELRPSLEQYFEKAKGYRTNRFELDKTQRELIVRRCDSYMRRHGYSARSPGPLDASTP
jgi:LPS sulfotransferase NodH